jgi:GNAT superfamily N-acetyltransferase
MNLRAREPHDNEWPICRMLLPETFSNLSGRTYLLFVRDEAPHIVAAASFRQAARAITHLRLHVVRSFRRCGVGSLVIEHFVRSGASSIEGTADCITEPGANAFCERNHFERLDSFTTVETDILGMLEYLRRLCRRITLPPNACTIPLSEAPIDQGARLHAEHIAHESELNPWRARITSISGMEHSPVAMIDGRVAGILLGKVENETVLAHSLVVAPAHRGGWINAVLLARGLEYAWNNGARRARFSFTDSSPYTQKIAARFHARAVSVVIRFSRRCCPESEAP